MPELEELEELEEMVAKLLATARTLAPGPDRIDIFKEIGRFRSQLASSQRSRSPGSGKMIKQPLWLPADDEWLRKLAAAGASLRQIAAQIGRSMSSVRTRALNLDVAIARDRNPMKGPQRPSAGAPK
jgi:hypothetical protein